MSSDQQPEAFGGVAATSDPARPGLAARETAHQHLVIRIPTASAQDTVQALLDRLRSEHFDTIDPVYLVDTQGRPTGTVALGKLLGADPQARLSSIASAASASVTLGTDQESVASHAINHGLTVVPVTGSDGRLVGVVPPAALIEVLRSEHVEDLHRIAGILREERNVNQALDDPPARRARHRLPWLIVGLIGSALSALVVKRFEDALQANMAIAFFIPAIVYLADAIGTQSEAIAVRRISLSGKPWHKLLAGELRTGLIIGSMLSLLSLAPVWLFVGDLKLALAVAMALFAASACATLIGFSLPWLLARTGTDPAFGSGPLATIAQDLLSLLIYFLMVSWLLL